MYSRENINDEAELVRPINIKNETNRLKKKQTCADTIGEHIGKCHKYNDIRWDELRTPCTIVVDDYEYDVTSWWKFNQEKDNALVVFECNYERFTSNQITEIELYGISLGRYFNLPIKQIAIALISWQYFQMSNLKIKVILSRLRKRLIKMNILKEYEIPGVNYRRTVVADKKWYLEKIKDPMDIARMAAFNIDATNFQVVGPFLREAGLYDKDLSPAKYRMYIQSLIATFEIEANVLSKYIYLLFKTIRCAGYCGPNCNICRYSDLDNIKTMVSNQFYEGFGDKIMEIVTPTKIKRSEITCLQLWNREMCEEVIPEIEETGVILFPGLYPMLKSTYENLRVTTRYEPALDCEISEDLSRIRDIVGRRVERTTYADIDVMNELTSKDPLQAAFAVQKTARDTGSIYEKTQALAEEYGETTETIEGEILHKNFLIVDVGLVAKRDRTIYAGSREVARWRKGAIYQPTTIIETLRIMMLERSTSDADAMHHGEEIEEAPT